MSEQGKNRRILIIDDNRAIHEDFRKILAREAASAELSQLEAEFFGEAPAAASSGRASEAYSLDSAYQGQEGVARVRASVEAGERYAVAFVDMRMPPGWDGLETIEKLWQADPEVQVVICSAYSDHSWEEIIRRLGHTDKLLILKKPFDNAEVCQLACSLTEKWHLARHAHLKLSQLEAMVREQTRTLEREVEERRRSEQALRRSEDRYALAAAGANDGLWDWDLEAGTIFLSPRWKEMLGHGFDELSASPQEWFSRVHADDLADLRSELDAHLAGRTPHFRREYRILHKDGQHRWMLCRGLAVRNSEGQAVRAAGSQTDITDRKMAEEQLRHDALHDTLTGLPNRALLMDRVERNLARARREPERLFAVLFMDLDRFKDINDSLGHLAGDQFLVGVARRLGECIRSADTLAKGGHGSLARFGGDEFVLLLEGIHQPADAVRVAERIQQALARPFRLGEGEVFGSTSIGIAMSAGYERAEDLLRDADTALYRAKAAGRGTFQIFDSAMHGQAVARWQAEHELRLAIDRGDLRLHFQPIVSLADGRPLALEALVRWQHPTRGLVMPGEFIDQAEETGLIVPLGDWVLREACRQMRRWQNLVPEAADVCLAVNVSARQFARNNFVERIAEILSETGFPGSRLKLELTENAAMCGAAAMVQRLNELRRLDVRIQLDDFGTGYSSLSYLHRMPIDTLKIDRSFVSTMGSEPMSRSIVQAIVSLARAMNVEVVAEGIETEQQWRELSALGCDMGQGYLFSKPVTPESVPQVLAKLTPARAAVA